MIYTQLKETTEMSARKPANLKNSRKRITYYFEPGISIQIAGIVFCDSTNKTYPSVHFTWKGRDL